MLGALLLSLAIANGPPDPAKGDPGLWPVPVRTRADFDAHSRALILTYVDVQEGVWTSGPTPAELGVPVVNETSLARWKNREGAYWLRAYLDSAKTCVADAPGCGFTGRTFSELRTFARALRLPDTFRPWLEMARAFSRRYLREQMRLAALFPSPPSEILPLGENDVLGDRFDDGEFLLTMDDGPAPDAFTAQYADILRSQGVHAFFFAIGAKLEMSIALLSPAGVAAIYEGHCLGSHGYEHVPHGERGRDSVAKTASLVRKVFPGTDAVHFRPPFGYRSEHLLASLAAHGAKSVLWNIDSQDWNDGLTADEVTARVKMLVLLRRKGVILFHDVKPKAFTAIPALAEWFPSAGWRWLDCREIR